MHSTNIINIQQATLRLLSDAQDIIVELQSSDVVSDSDSSKQKQTLVPEHLSDLISILKNENQKASNMEMVVAVVGTMKSGKSTTINAIVGQEILPNRELPMTALPTLVTHKKGCVDPVLMFNHPDPLIKLSEEIAGIVKTKDISSGHAFFGSSDGKRLLKELAQSGKLEIKNKYTGQKEVFEFLYKLNDLMRAAKELSISPPYKEYEGIDSLPRIDVEFFHLKNKDDLEHGRLSILDTPGPNEFGQGEVLKQVLKTQLAQASAVLLVMDYTQLNSDADGSVRTEVASMQDSLGERLFVLVNKFDNSNKNTMNVEDTKGYVSTHLLENMSSERVFPVSSLLAYLANRALSELDFQGKINEEDDWVKDFGVEALGRLWTKKINDNKEVKEAAMALWEDSNFTSPLDKVITEAHAKAAFESLGSTLSKLSSIFNGLDTGLNGRMSGLKVDIDLLNKMINDLRNDQKKLTDIEYLVDKKIKDEIDKSTVEITEKLGKYIDKADKLAKEFLKTGKVDNDKQKKELANKEKKEKDPSLHGFLHGFLQGSKKTPETVQDAFESGNEIIYKKKADAENLLTSIDKEISNITTVLFVEAEKVLQTSTRSLQNSLDSTIKKDLSDILEQAKNRLKDQGVKVNFKLPLFDRQSNISFTLEDFLTSGIEEHTYEESRSRIINSFTHFFWDSWGREDYIVEETDYKVDIPSIKEKIKSSMLQLKKSIEDSHLDFLEHQLKESVNQQIHEVKNYLELYRGDLMQGIKDQQANSQKKNSYIEELDYFLKPFRNLSEDIDDQLNLLNEIKNRGNNG